MAMNKKCILSFKVTRIAHHVCTLLQMVHMSNSRRIHDNGDGLYMVFYDDNIPWARWSVYTTRSLHK